MDPNSITLECKICRAPLRDEMHALDHTSETNRIDEDNMH